MSTGSTFWQDEAAARVKVTLSQRTQTIPSPARVREQWVLAPLGHVAMVIAVVHSLRGVVSGQVVRRGILSRSRATPLAQRLLGAVGAVDVVAYNPWLAGLRHGHVEDPCVVLRAGEMLGAACGRANLMRAALRGLVWNSCHIGDSGLKAAAS